MVFFSLIPRFVHPLIGVLLGMISSSCGSTSSVLIAPQQNITLTGGENGVFRVRVVNEGTVPVVLSERLEHGESIRLGLLQRKDRRKLKFLAGSEAVFTNPTTDTAQVKLRVFGSTNVDTQYQPHW